MPTLASMDHIVSKIVHIFNASLCTDGEQANIGTKDFPDINCITGALKLYLRQLPIPLVPFEVYDKFTAAASKLRFIYSDLYSIALPLDSDVAV